MVSDNLPNEICQPCLLDLTVSYKFVVRFNRSQELLKALVQQIYDGVKITDNFNNHVPPTSPLKKENKLESSTVTDLNNSLLDHNYHSSQNHSEAEGFTEDRNVSDITIMTIEDVLKEERKRTKKKTNGGHITKVTVQNGIKKKVVGTRESSNVRRKRSEEELGAYKCEICDMVYQSNARLVNHKYSMHNANWMEVFKCSVCRESYETRASKL